jgi:CBS domain-containing protein
MELVRNLMVESVSRLELGTPLCMRPEQTIRESVACMREHQLGYVLVCREGRLVGIFTERDLLRRVIAVGRSLEQRLEEVMTREPVVAFPGMPIATAVRRMEEGGYRHLPVVDTMSRPLGVLSVKRIMLYLVEHFPATICNLPPDPSAVALEAEGA